MTAAVAADVRYVLVGADRLTYSVPRGLALEVGDTVTLPPLPWMTSAWRAQVVAIGRDGYQGPCRAVLGKVDLLAEAKRELESARGQARFFTGRVKELRARVAELRAGGAS